MHYMLVLANAPDEWDATDATPDDGVIDDWGAYTRALAEAGVLVGGSALHPADTATTVRVRAGDRLLTDGPYAEVREHLIGYYVIDCDDLDEALAWAGRVPCVRTGSVEVRPVVPGSSVDEVLGRAP